MFPEAAQTIQKLGRRSIRALSRNPEHSYKQDTLGNVNS
jgi:hypothetical protein